MGRLAFITDLQEVFNIQWRRIGSYLWWLCVLWLVGEVLLATVECSYNNLRERVVLPGEV